MANSPTGYVAVYTDGKGRRIGLLPVVDFKGGSARVSLRTGQLISAQEHDMGHFSGVEPLE